MAMAGHLLQLKQPRPHTWSSESFHSAQIHQRCSSTFGPNPRTEQLRRRIVRFGGKSRERDGLYKLGFGGKLCERDGFCNLGFGDYRKVAVCATAAAGGEGESREVEVVDDEVDPLLKRDVDPDDNSSFPAEFKELIVDRGDPPNVYLFAAGVVVVVLMRHVILQELAQWGINFARILFYIAEGITRGFSKLMEVGAEPISIFSEIADWATTTVRTIYALIVGAPTGSLASTLFLSLAVLSIGDVATREVKGPRSQLVGFGAALGVAGVLEILPADLMLLALVALTVSAKFIQKSDLVTVFMPATVTFVAISSPLVRAAAFGLFLAVSVYANWKSAREAQQLLPELVTSERLSPPAFSVVAAVVCISFSARLLSFRTVKWLLLKSA